MVFWGVVFILVTVCVCVFKKEAAVSTEEGGDEESVSLHIAYQQIFSIVQLPAIISLSLILFTVKVAGMYKIQ